MVIADLRNDILRPLWCRDLRVPWLYSDISKSPELAIGHAGQGRMGPASA